MKIVAPVKVDDDGYAEKLSILDLRKISIILDKNGDETIRYNGKLLESYKKTIFNPSMQRE